MHGNDFERQQITRHPLTEHGVFFRHLIDAITGNRPANGGGMLGVGRSASAPVPSVLPKAGPALSLRAPPLAMPIPPVIPPGRMPLPAIMGPTMDAIWFIM